MGNMVDYLLASTGGGSAAPAPVGSLAAAFSAAQGSGAASGSVPGGAAASAKSGGTGAGTTPPASIDPAQQLQSTLENTIYPQIQREVINAFNGAPDAPGAGNGFFGSLAANEGLTGTGALGVFQDAKLALSALNPLGWPMLLGGFFQTLFGGDKPSPPTWQNFGWNVDTGNTTQVQTDKGIATLPAPTPSFAGAFGLTPQQLAAMGPGVADAYPFGQGAPYTAGSGIYSGVDTGATPNGAMNGVSGFFVPGSTPQSYFPTDYFGNVTGGATSFLGRSAPDVSGNLSPPMLASNLASDSPLAPGAPTPSWLASDINTWQGFDQNSNASMWGGS